MKPGKINFLLFMIVFLCFFFGLDRAKNKKRFYYMRLSKDELKHAGYLLNFNQSVWV